MRPRSVALLAVLAALLAAYLLLFERRVATTDEAAVKRRRLLPALDVGAVRELRIAGRGRAAVELERVGGVWRLRSAPAGPADAAEVRRLLSSLEFLEWTRELPAGRNPRQLGLAPAQLVVTLQRARGAAWRLELGGQDPSGTGVYARSGEKIVVVDASGAAALDVGPQTLRERDLVPFTAAALRRIVLQRGASSLDLRRGADGLWRVGTLQLLARPATADGLAGAAAALRARRFLADSAAPAGGATLRLETASAQRELRLLGVCPGRPSEQRVALRHASGWLHACVSAEALAPLTDAREAALYDRALSRMRAADLARIEIVRGSAFLSVERRGTRWHYTLTKGRPLQAKLEGEADPDHLRSWVAALARVEGSVDGSPAAAAAARALDAVASVTLLRDGGARWKLRFGTPSAGRLPVRRGDEPALLWLDPGVLGQLAVDPLLWRERTVLRLPRYEVVRLLWQRGPKQAVERAEHHDDGWRVTVPAGLAIDEGVLRRLLDRLGALRAERFATAPAGTDTASTTGTTRLSVTLEHLRVGQAKQLRTVALRLQALPAGRCRGELAASQPPFELAAADCEALTAHLAERRLLRFRRAALTELELRLRDGRRLHLRRGVDGWAGAGRRPGAAAISALLDVLEKLEAERVLSYGHGPSALWPARRLAGRAGPGLRVTLVARSTRQQLMVDDAGTAIVAGRAVRYQLGPVARQALLRVVMAALGPHQH